MLFNILYRSVQYANEDYERVTDSNIMKKVVYIPGNGLLSSVLDTVINSKVRFIYYIIYAIILIPTPLLIGDFIRSLCPILYAHYYCMET